MGIKKLSGGSQRLSGLLHPTALSLEALILATYLLPCGLIWNVGA